MPAIVLAELYYIAKKHDHELSLGRLLDDLHETAGYVSSPLGREQLEELGEVIGVEEMHDKLIAADARVRDAIVVSRDPILHASPAVTTVW